ncbi:MAG: hypothetical protein Q4E24_01380 [bacterium]|nr:hypothetical protein [bacterium]
MSRVQKIHTRKEVGQGKKSVEEREKQLAMKNVGNVDWLYQQSNIIWGLSGNNT